MLHFNAYSDASIVLLSLGLFVRRSSDDTEHLIETQGVLKTTLYKNNSNNNWWLSNLAI